jgi:hypothetical protein
MKKTLKFPVGLPTLAEVEQEVVAEYRELGRQELARRLQALAEQAGELFPPTPPATPPPDIAHRTGADPTDHGLRPGSPDAKMV